MGNVQWSADVRLDQQQIVWDVEMDIPDLPLKDRFPKIAGKSGSFGLKGGGRVDLITLDVSATWEWFLKGLLPPFSELAGTMNISGNREALSFDHRMQQPGELILQGEVSGVVSGALQVEADLTWKEWRLDASFTDAFQFLETSGRVHFSGNRERYQATLASSLQPHPFGLTQLTLVVDGHAGGIEDLRLEWQPQTGKAVMAGQVNWQQGFTIDLGLSLEEMDPSEWLAAWPGHVSAKVHLNARQDSPASSEWPIFDITLESLQGELQKIPFSGQGRIQGGGEQIVIERLQLDALSGQISANGTLSSSGKTQVDLFLDLPELALWKPGAQGKVKASGVLSGSLADPALSLRIDGWDTAYEQVAIERWGLDLTGGGAWREGGEVKFSAQQLSALGQHWTALDLLFQGGRLEQEILLRTEGEWALTLMGKGDWAGSQWQGALHTFSLENERIGKWNNSDVWKVNWEEGLARLDAGCLQSGGNRFCVSAQGGPNQDSTMRMQVNMTEYPFLDKVLAVPVQLEGNVSAVIEAERLASGKLNATASLLSEEGRLVFPGESGRSMEVPFEIEALTLVLNPQKIEGQWAVRFFEKERLEGNVRLHSSAKEWGYDEISAKAHADFSNFMILSALVPEVSIPSGALKADLRMEGEVSSPEIWGEATVKNGRLMVDEMGLVMDQFELQATWSGQEAQLRLETVSGAGRLGVEAEASLQALSRWHLSGRVRGQDFPVANTTAYQVDVSPDLSFDLTPQRLTIEGEVIVPRARVVLRELPPSGIRVSQDVIVVDAESPRTARKSQWDARLTLKTGKEVFFKGFGLEGMIDGDLLFERKPESGEALFGELSVRNGRYRALGYHLDIVRGTVVFAGSPRNPGLDVAAERRLLSGQAVPVIISGTVLEPVLQLPQSNELGESDAFSRLLTGRGVGASGSDVLSDQVTMMGIGITENLTQGLADDFGLDTAGLKTEAGLETTSLYLGKQITPLLYVGYDIGLFDTERKVEVKLKLGRRWSLEAASGNDSGADFIYSYETRPPVSRSATRERVQDTKDSVSAPPESPDFSSEKHSAQSNSE
jgi:translocation and assembly module TamB